MTAPALQTGNYSACDHVVNCFFYWHPGAHQHIPSSLRCFVERGKVETDFSELMEIKTCFLSGPQCSICLPIPHKLFWLLWPSQQAVMLQAMLCSLGVPASAAGRCPVGSGYSDACSVNCASSVAQGIQSAHKKHTPMLLLV